MPLLPQKGGEDGSLEQTTVQQMKDILDGDGGGGNWSENLVKEYHTSKNKVGTRSLDEPPGIRFDPKEPWEVPLPVSDDDNDDGDEDDDKNPHPAVKAIKDHWKLFLGPIGYDDTGNEREYKLAWSDHLKNNFPEPPIDEKDTMPGMLSYDNKDEERRKNTTIVEKYRKRFKSPPKYTFP